MGREARRLVPAGNGQSCEERRGDGRGLCCPRTRADATRCGKAKAATSRSLLPCVDVVSSSTEAVAVAFQLCLVALKWNESGGVGRGECGRQSGEAGTPPRRSTVGLNQVTTAGAGRTDGLAPAQQARKARPDCSGGERSNTLPLGFSCQ